MSEPLMEVEKKVGIKKGREKVEKGKIEHKICGGSVLMGLNNTPS